MFYFSYLINSFKPRNLALTFYCLINYLIVAFIMYSLNLVDLSSLSALGLSNQVLNAILGVVLNLVFRLIALSPLGEAVGRLRLNYRKLIRDESSYRIYSIFDDVYSKAKSKSKHIGDKVKLYIKTSDEINAMAYGKSTICITTGLATVENDAVIFGIIAHEFGHIANQDSYRIISLDNSLFLLSIFVNVLFVLSFLVGLITTMLAATQNPVLAFVKIISFAFLWAIRLVVLIAFKIWVGIGHFIVFLSTRQCEYKADEYSANLGFSDGLIIFFEWADENYPSNSFLSFFFDEHPSFKKRIAFLLKKSGEKNAQQLSN